MRSFISTRSRMNIWRGRNLRKPRRARAARASRAHLFPAQGAGQYQRAPEAQLKAALAGLERRQQQAEQQAIYEAELKARRWPAAFDGKALTLLTKPDKNAIESKALNAAA